MKKKDSIVYVNFAPYDNAGKILDYLVANFSLVVHFSFDFHKLNRKHSSNIICVYKNGRAVKTIPLIQIKTPESLLFITLPFRAPLIAFIIFMYLFLLQKKYGRFYYYFTVNAYTAWIGNICRKLNMIKKTIFWLWDYYPPGNSDWKVRIASYLYRRFDKVAASASNRIFFLSHRLEELRRLHGGISPNQKYEIIPIATDPKRCKIKKPEIIGHLGVLKKNQGLGYVFDSLRPLSPTKQTFKLEIIGSGPDEEYFKNRAKEFGDLVTFYGFVKDENKLQKIVSNWRVGLALYMPGEKNVSYWTDPSKIKYYLSQGVPTITTNVVSFAKEITSHNAGIIVPYGNKKALIVAIKTMINNYKKYGNNAYEVAKKYNYKTLYPRFFK